MNFTRLTRKYNANPYEITEILGEVPISVDQVLALNRLNFQVYPFFSGNTINDYVLTPENLGTPTTFTTGARIHFHIKLVNNRDVPTLAVQGDTTRTLVAGNGAAITAGMLRPGFYSAVLQENGNWQIDVISFQEREWDYIWHLIRGCIRGAEEFMNLDLIPKQYRTFRNDLTGDFERVIEIRELGGVVFELRKGPVMSVDSFTYTDLNGITQTLDPAVDYYVAGQKVVLRGTNRPTKRELQVVQIQFTSGMESIPSDLFGALLDHIAQAYEMHGVCDGVNCPAGMQVPSGARAIYDMYRPMRLGE